MIEIRRLPPFVEFINSLRDERAKAKISARIDRLAIGNAGDVAAIGEGLSELRLHFGPGYGVYFVQRGKVLVILLCGGNKSSQSRDIKRAKQLAQDMED